MNELQKVDNLTLDNPIARVFSQLGTDLTKAAYRTCYQRVARILGSEDWVQFPWERLSIEEWFVVRSQLKQELKPVTYNKYMGQLRRLVNVLYSLGLIPLEDRVQLTEEILNRNKKARSIRAPVVLSLEEINAIEQVFTDNIIGSRDRALFYVLLYCGLRRNEAVTLTWANIDFSECRIDVLGKGDRQDYVYFEDNTRQALEEWRDLRTGDTVFCGFTLKGNQNGALSERGLSEIVNKWRERAQVREFKPHDFRRTGASHLFESTGDLNAVQRWLRHENAVTTQHYLFEINGEKVRAQNAKTLSGIYGGEHE